MVRFTFFAKLVLVILLITLPQAAVIELLFYFVMNATFEELKLMAMIPIVDVAVINLVYIGLAVSLSLILVRFLEAAGGGEAVSESEVRKVLDRAVNLPYFLGGLSFLFFTAGTTVITLRSLVPLGWPLSSLGYGVLGGAVCGLLAFPLYMVAGNWLVNPVIEKALDLLPPLQSAIKSGLRLSFSFKLLMMVVALVVVAASYTSIVGYSQTTGLLNNMKRMELLLPDSARSQLTVQPESSMDPRIRGSEFYESHLGGLKAFYISLMAGVSVISILMALSVARQFTRPIGLLGEGVRRVKEGDFGRPIRFASNDEFANLGVAFNTMMFTITDQLEHLESMMVKLKDGIRRMDETVSTMLEISMEQAHGATEQATAINEATTTTEEIVATAREIANRAKLVEDVARSTRNASQEGETKLGEAWSGFREIVDQVDNFQETMRELEQKFMETYKIVKLMEDIAEQTELLALNAALEAAGAGEEGRRFSVVAQATRRLAQRSAEATAEIKDVVENIQGSTFASAKVAEHARERVERGGKVIKEAVESLQTISAFAGSTSTSVSEISQSTAEQSSASEQLATAFSNIQLVASRVEEGARAINDSVSELREYANSLRKGLDID